MVGISSQPRLARDDTTTLGDEILPIQEASHKTYFQTHMLGANILAWKGKIDHEEGREAAAHRAVRTHRGSVGGGCLHL